MIRVTIRVTMSSPSSQHASLHSGAAKIRGLFSSAEPGLEPETVASDLGVDRVSGLH